MLRQVTFMSNGRCLLGTLHLPEIKTGLKAPGVVLLHGFTGDKNERYYVFVKLARALEKAGLAVLRFDFHGCGESEGEFLEAGIDGQVRDAREALKFLREQGIVDPDRVGLLGYSLGGTVASLVAGRGEPLKALVLWAPAASLLGIAESHQYVDLQDQYDRLGYMELPMTGLALPKEFINDVMKLDPLEEFKRYTGPLLLVHGEQDEFVPPFSSEMYLQASRSTDKSLHIVKGGDHGFGGIAGKADAISTTVAWLEERL